MALNWDVRTWRDTNAVLQLLPPLWPDLQPATWLAAASQLTSPPAAYATFFRSGYVPSWAWIDDGNTVGVWCSGVATPQQGVLLFASTTQALTTSGSWRANGITLVAAQTMLSQLQLAGLGGRRQWLLVGHSYGGSALLVLAALLLQQLGPVTVQVVTFGSPRPGDVALSQALASSTVRRVMCDSDPVCRFPPKLWEGPTASLAAGLAVASVWAQYDQPAGGIQLDSRGNATAQPLPGNTLPIADVTLAQWAVGFNGPLSAAHSIQEYVRRVGAAAAGVIPQIGGALAAALAELAQPLDPAMFNAVANGAPAIPPSPLATGESPMGYVPPLYRAKVVKIGNAYTIQWMSGQIGIGTTKSNAKNIARHLNGLLSRFLTLKSLDHVQAPAQLTNWITAASSTGLGFNPPLNVT